METDPIMVDRFEKLALLLALFDQHGIAYVLVGESPERLRREIPGDVDIVVSWDGNRKLPSVFRELRDLYGVELIHVYRHEIGVFGALLAWRYGDSWNRVGPDICSDYYRNGRLLLSSNELLFGRHCDSSTGFWLPRAECDFAYYFVKKVGKGSLSETQIRFLRSRLEESSEEHVREILSRWFLPSQIDGILGAVMKLDVSELRGKLLVLREILRRRTRPSALTRSRDVWRKVSRLSQPCGVVYCVCVPEMLQNSVCNAWMDTIAPLFRHVSVSSIPAKGHLFRFVLGVLRAKWHSHAVLIPVSLSPNAVQMLVMRAMSDRVMVFSSDCEESHIGPQLLESVIQFLSFRTARRFGWQLKKE